MDEDAKMRIAFNLKDAKIFRLIVFEDAKILYIKI